MCPCFNSFNVTNLFFLQTNLQLANLHLFDFNNIETEMASKFAKEEKVIYNALSTIVHA